MEYMYGVMREDIKGIGLLTNCMEEVCINGHLEGSMKENIKMITNMDLDLTHGRMAENISENGKITKGMGKAN